MSDAMDLRTPTEPSLAKGAEPEDVHVGEFEELSAHPDAVPFSDAMDERQQESRMGAPNGRPINRQLSAYFMRDCKIEQVGFEAEATPTAIEESSAPLKVPIPLLKVERPATLEGLRPAGFAPLTGRRGDLPVPTCSEELTAEWLTLAFRASGRLATGEAVASVRMKPLGAGEGEMSDLVMLTLEVTSSAGDATAGGGGGGGGVAAPALPRRLVAKFSSPSMSSSEIAFTFGHEAHFYNDFSVDGGALVRPGALYVGYVKARCGKKDLYCIIQELCGTPDQPAVCFKRVDGCGSARHIALTMRTLARFHARWWDATQSGPLAPFLHPDTAGGPLPRFPRFLVQTAYVLVFKNGLKALAHLFSDEPRYKGVSKFAQEYAGFVKAIRPIVRRRRHAVIRELWSKRPLTLVHGDAHVENIFFGEAYPGGCAFIDFGLTQLAPAMGDVATVIGGGMPVGARRAHEDKLVREYHRALTEDFGVSATQYSYEQCWRDYQFQLIKPFFQLLKMAPGLVKHRNSRTGLFAPEPSEGDAKLRAMYAQINTRLATALIDHKWKERVEEMPYTANYCCRPLA